MNQKISCSVIRDLLPLYAEKLISEDTEIIMEGHLKECSGCQREYKLLKENLESPVSEHSGVRTKEIHYLKKIKTYQNINLVLGAILSFLLGAVIPLLKVGIPVMLRGKIPEYYLARLRIAWHIGALKMVVSGLVVCGIYLLFMLILRRWTSRGLCG